jgi:hypothetical protein
MGICSICGATKGVYRVVARKDDVGINVRGVAETGCLIVVQLGMLEGPICCPQCLGALTDSPGPSGCLSFRGSSRALQ